MNTHRYEIPAAGPLLSVPEKIAFLDSLEQNLTDGYDCLPAYCIFPPDSDILESVSLKEENNQISKICLSTYTKLYDGCEKELKECLSENLATASKDAGLSKPVVLAEGPVTHSLEGNLPRTLYHIAEEENLPFIQKNGLIPGNGSNRYKDMENHIYLCEDQDLAPWLCVLKHMDHPVLLRIDTAAAGADIKSARFFSDRAYIPGGYGEYRTKDRIPSLAVEKVDLEKEPALSEMLQSRMEQICALANEQEERKEVETGLSRLSFLNLPQADSLQLASWDDPESFEDAINSLSAPEISQTK